MNEQWPSERLAEDRQMTADTSFKTAQDFLALLNTFPNGLPRAFDDVVIWIVEQDGDLSELERRIDSIVDAINLKAYPDSQCLLMTFACASALAKAPTLFTKRKVSAFRHNSWQLEHWLEAAMLAYVTDHPSAGSAYVTLAKAVFVALEDFSLQSPSDLVNKERAGTWANWIERKDKLDEIWWDLRGWSGFRNYAPEQALFRVFYKLAPDEFIRTISRSSNPYLVNALLFSGVIGALPAWQQAIVAAPNPFEDDGRWNGAVLLPLLLVEARNQLLQAQRNFRTSAATADELDRIKQEITGAAELIATTLAARQDASAIFSRWTPWLMRQVLRHESKNVTDVKSLAFADDTLIDAIGRHLENCVLLRTSPEDAAPWEPWCYRCALSSFALNGHIPVPDWEDFGNEWRLAPEDWMDRKGRLLRERASLITIMSKETPGIAAHALAYPIAQSPTPGQAWVDLWRDAITLREIVEFGDSDATQDEYSSRADAGRLLLLLFRIGLAIFDQGAAQCADNNSSEARSLAILFKALHAATSEMREIDSTLNHDEWLMMVQHLTIRRIILERSSAIENGGVADVPRDCQVFRPNDTPTVLSILVDIKGDVIELVGLLQSLLLNHPDISRLRDHLKSASLNLSSIMHSIRDLNRYHPRKYPIDEKQLQKLEAQLTR